MSGIYRIYRLEMSAIYVVAALLIISLTSLGMRVSAVHKTVKANSLYPSLNCKNTAEIFNYGKKTIYFTFDDGPSHNTEKVLDVLAKENVKATFFVCAQEFDDVDAPALLRRILAEGHEIGLHSYSHDYGKVYSSLEGYLEDLNAINDYIIEATGHHANIVRFPGGSGTCNASRSLIKEISGEMTRRGYRIYDWDVESGDQTSSVRSAEYIADKIVNDTKDRERVIILLHDSPGPKTTPEAVSLAIPRLREQGYMFASLTASVDPARSSGI